MEACLGISDSCRLGLGTSPTPYLEYMIEDRQNFHKYAHRCLSIRLECMHSFISGYKRHVTSFNTSNATSNTVLHVCHRDTGFLALIGHILGQSAQGATTKEQINLFQGLLLGFLEAEIDDRQGNADV